MRMIDADDLEKEIQNIRKEYHISNDELEHDIGYIGALCLAQSMVRRSPTVGEATPTESRARGRWIHCKETKRFREHWGCSNCGHDITENPRFRNTATGERLDFVFCPYCGAIMEEG